MRLRMRISTKKVMLGAIIALLMFVLACSLTVAVYSRPKAEETTYYTKAGAGETVYDIDSKAGCEPGPGDSSNANNIMRQIPFTNAANAQINKTGVYEMNKILKFGLKLGTTANYVQIYISGNQWAGHGFKIEPASNKIMFSSAGAVVGTLFENPAPAFQSDRYYIVEMGVIELFSDELCATKAGERFVLKIYYYEADGTKISLVDRTADDTAVNYSGWADRTWFGSYATTSGCLYTSPKFLEQGNLYMNSVPTAAETYDIKDVVPAGKYNSETGEITLESIGSSSMSHNADVYKMDKILRFAVMFPATVGDFQLGIGTNVGDWAGYRMKITGTSIAPMPGNVAISAIPAVIATNKTYIFEMSLLQCYSDALKTEKVAERYSICVYNYDSAGNKTYYANIAMFDYVHYKTLDHDRASTMLKVYDPGSVGKIYSAEKFIPESFASSTIEAANESAISANGTALADDAAGKTSSAIYELNKTLRFGFKAAQDGTYTFKTASPDDGSAVGHLAELELSGTSLTIELAQSAATLKTVSNFSKSTNYIVEMTVIEYFTNAGKTPASKDFERLFFTMYHFNEDGRKIIDCAVMSVDVREGFIKRDVDPGLSCQTSFVTDTTGGQYSILAPELKTQTKFYSSVNNIYGTGNTIEISNRITMNAEGIVCKAEAGGLNREYDGAYSVNKLLQFSVELGAGNTDFQFGFSANSLWDKYQSKISVGNTTVYYKFAAAGAAPATIGSVPIPANKRLYIETGVFEFFEDSAKQVKAFERFVYNIFYYNESNEKTALIRLGNETNGDLSDAPQSNFDCHDYPTVENRSKLFFYTGANMSFTLLPYTFSRDYKITLNGKTGTGAAKTNTVDLSYNGAYDFSGNTYTETRVGYTLSGWSYTDGDGQKRLITVLTGTWLIDFTAQSGGNYVGTLTAEYALVERTVNYTFTNGNSNGGNPETIDIEKGEVTLKPAVPNNGYIFVGWYTDAGFTESITKISYTEDSTAIDQPIQLYARIVVGYTVTLVYPDGTTGSESVPDGLEYTLPSAEISGYQRSSTWEKYTGGGDWTQSGASDWEEITGSKITPSGNLVLRLITTAIEYTISFNTDGGENDARNINKYTIEDNISFYPAVKEGFFFVGWYIGGGDELLTGILPGTTGNITLKAKYFADTIPSEIIWLFDSNAKVIPIPSLPAGSAYTVKLYDADDTAFENELTITGNTYLFDTPGRYVLVYDITLPFGSARREVSLIIARTEIVVDGTYDATYTAGTTLTILEAYCDDSSVIIAVTVTRNGEAVTVTDGKIILEEGVYVILYHDAGGDVSVAQKSFEFSVTKKPVNGKKGCGGCSTIIPFSGPGGTAAMILLIAAGGLFASVICKRKKRAIK